jgi:hypothetical protein
MADPDKTFFDRLVSHHVSGQLKVAPEHCAAGVLNAMGKPEVGVYEKFRKEYFRLCEKHGLEQYLVPYLMSSHPGSTMADAVTLACWLKKWGYAPEQVQDFYPTPGTVSTTMYYTGIHPLTGKSVYVATDYKEKQMQRALLQFSKPQNAHLVREALRYAGREDLIGDGPACLVREDRRAVGGGSKGGAKTATSKKKTPSRPSIKKPARGKETRPKRPPVGSFGGEHKKRGKKRS